MPGMKPMAKPPAPPSMGAPATPPMPPAAGKPPSPPMPGLPGIPGAAAPRPPSSPGVPGMPPMPPAPGGAGPFTPALGNKLAEADTAKTQMEQQIAELEKKLLEEREKVLLASLRSKEEEAVSAKVETSIKEIQDKLRREKREQELDDSRRKAEARALDLERRMAEEREAWVATLKTQMGQRDQVTQEMEMHFSARLKDLEYRWSQEKAGLESALREREAELARVRHEMQIKSEQEKAFWEDRVKSMAGERDKVDRDMERAKDKFAQEKDHLLMERQSLRDQLARAESSLKLIEDQHRSEKSALHRESEANQGLLKQQLVNERESAERQIIALNAQVQNQMRDLTERTVHANSVDQQLTAARSQINQLDFRLQEKDRQLEDARRRASENESLTGGQRKKYEDKIEELTKELSEVRLGAAQEVQRVSNEADTRIKTLQSRLDWYDSNVKREYDGARMQVQEEVNQLRARVKEAERIAEEHKVAGESSSSLRMELDQVRADWKQAQWDMEAQVKELNSQLQSAQSKLEQAEDARISLEQELRQRSSNADYTQTQIEQREAEIKKLSDKIDQMAREAEIALQKQAVFEQQADEYKKLLQGKGLPNMDEMRAQLDEKAAVLEKTKEALHRATVQLEESGKKDDLFREKEKALKQIIADKEDMASEFKARLSIVDRKLQQLQKEHEEFLHHAKEDREKLIAQKQADVDAVKAQAKEDREKAIAQKQADIDAVKAQAQDDLRALEAKKSAEIEQARRQAADEATARIGSEAPAVNTQEIEDRVRQQLESENLDRLREKETEVEERAAKEKEEFKKELDRLKWESETMRDELKRAREARAQIEREAQELLQQAEAHYQRELAKNTANLEAQGKKPTGFFTTIGRLLDTPIVDTKKKKDDLPPTT